MARNYSRYLREYPYTLPQIIKQVEELKKTYLNVQYSFKKGKAVITLSLRPTENSIIYTIMMKCCIGCEKVQIYVVAPKIQRVMNGRVVPHQYPDGSLCLYYPPYYEWSYRDSWAETLIPWTSLWLYYYEIWEMTGEWLGGGIHGSKRSDDKERDVSRA